MAAQWHKITMHQDYNAGVIMSMLPLTQAKCKKGFSNGDPATKLCILALAFVCTLHAEMPLKGDGTCRQLRGHSNSSAYLLKHFDRDTDVEE